jgi:hypothetical protein
VNHSDGADIRQALTLLVQAGYSASVIARDVEVSLTTVRRWAAGVQRPNRENFTRLRQRVMEFRSDVLRRRTLSAVPEDLTFRAVEALRTTPERADIAEIVARVTASPVPAPRRSAYAGVNEFDLITSGRPEPAYPF